MTPRRGHFWAMIFWLAPGAYISWLLRDSVAWVTFMSWYALVGLHLTGWGAGRAEEAATTTDGGTCASSPAEPTQTDTDR